MILLDLDLDPDPAPRATTARKTAAFGSDKTTAIPTVRTLSRFLALAQKTVRLRGEVNVQLTTDVAIRKLNLQFRGKNKATDVLSFPAGGIGAEEIAGDLAISVPTALRQATGQGHSLTSEIKVLILHGLLHLAGYDHEADEGQMARRERLFRARLGLTQGLIERAKSIPPGPHKQRRGKDGANIGKRSSRTNALVDGRPAIRSLKAPAPSDSDSSVDCAQGLKPGPSTSGLAAQLKSCPFKAGKNEVRGIPLLRQKQKHLKNGAPSIVGPSGTKRGAKP
jgi:probable rRNA maturation factor